MTDAIAINLPSTADVNIVLAGKTTLKSNLSAISSDNDGTACTVTISGSGALDAAATTGAAILMYGSEQTLVIAGGTITAQGATAAITSKAGITLTGTEIKSPTGAQIGDWQSKKAVLNADGDPAASVTIGKKTVSTGGSSSNTTTTTTKNPDGSTTTTVTNKTTGTVTETTKQPDGSTVVVETKKDGTATITDKAASGVTTVTKTDKNGVATGATVTVPSSVKDGADISVPTDLGKTEGTVVVKLTLSDGTAKTVMGTYADGKVNVTVPETATVTVQSAVTAPVSEIFTDVPENAWYGDDLQFMVTVGLLNGKTANHFGASESMNRQQMWMVLARMAGKNPASMAEARKWAVDNGISDGTNPTGNVSRQQFITLIWRACGAPKSTKDMSGYTDFGKVADYATEAFAWAVENDIVNGTSAATLSPEKSPTRAQIAVILSRHLSK